MRTWPVVAVAAIIAWASPARAQLAPLTDPAQLGTAEDVLDKPKCKTGSKRWFVKCKDQQSYVHTIEGWLHVFHSYIDGVGGGYVGVGSVQGLALAARAHAANV